MREILFRGQTRRYGEKVDMAGKKLPSNWVYGGIFPQNDDGDFAVIYQQEPEIKKFSVYADTVGQYTGLMDKYGQKIFEGDILAGDRYPFTYDGKRNYFAEVVWFEDCPAFGLYTLKNPHSNVFGISSGNTELMENWDASQWEVIGNRCDDSDFLIGQ